GCWGVVGVGWWGGAGVGGVTVDAAVLQAMSRGRPVRSCVDQPAGSAGATTPSKFSLKVPLHGSWHMSLSVQTFPSLHGPLADATCVHPTGDEQPSVVQSLPSSQFVGPPGWHEPPPQMSPVVHGLLSVQGAVLFVKVQPCEGDTHVSSVQPLLSLQTKGAWLQVPAGLTQVSTVQTSPSLQLTGVPGWQTPLLQTSAPL